MTTMDIVGTGLSASGSVLTIPQLEEQRRKRGECLTCGQKCFQKKLFKLIPLDIHGLVLNGKCIKCNPLDVSMNNTVLPAVSRPATSQDLARFTRSQSSLRLQGPGVQSNGRTHSSSPGPLSSTMHRGPSSQSLGGASVLTAPPSLGLRNHNVPIGASTPRRNIQDDRSSQRSSRSADDDIEAEPSESRGKRRSRNGVSRSISLQEPRHMETEQNLRNSRSTSMLGTERSLEHDGGGVSFPLPFHEQQYPGRVPLSASYENDEVDEDDSDLNRSGDIRSAMIGSMAARQIQANFRQRKAERAAMIVPESAQTHDYEERLSPAAKPRPKLAERPQSTDSGSLGTTSWKTDEENQLPPDFREPIHGVLNRGGQFKFEDAVRPQSTDGSASAPFSTMNAESNRTMSTMSSIEEDSGAGGTASGAANGNRQLSWKPAAEFSMKKRAEDLFEQDDDDLSIDSMTGSYRSREKEDGVTSNRSSLSGRFSARGGQSAIQEQRAVESMAEDSENFHEVLGYMREYPKSALVQQEGLKHISNLHLTTLEYTEMLEIGALGTVIKAMKTHIKNLELQSGACRAIWNLSATPQNQMCLAQEGALDCILAAMDRYPHEPELQEKALAALSNLGAVAENQDLILQKGVIKRVVEAMNNHSEDGPVQAKACSALTNFASYDSPLKRQIMDLSGGGAVVIAMVMHPEDIDLQEKALRALRNICANSDDNKIEVASVGGIDAVISAMQVHRDEPGVQEAGAWTLSNLAVNPENKAVIGDSGGIDVVIRAMWVHSDHVGVQEWCCRALWTLSVDAHNRQVMIEVGGICAVVNAMQAHADAATVQEKGCGVLSNLAATDDESKIRIVEEEALDAIIMAMVLHSENRSVQDRACSVLKRLAIGPNLKSMQAANVGELVRQAGKKFPDKCREKASALLKLL